MTQWCEFQNNQTNISSIPNASSPRRIISDEQEAGENQNYEDSDYDNADEDFMKRMNERWTKDE